jgi:hypothetical protein
MKFTTGLYGHSYDYVGSKTICYVSGAIGKDDMHWVNISAKGIAVCSPEDKYDEGFGKSLATVRAYQNFYKKVEKELIKYSYKKSRENSLNNCVVNIGKRLYKLTEVYNDK